MRNDGYDVSSRIANGLDRMVDSLEITGLLRGTSSHAWSFASVTAMSAGLWNNDGQDDEATGPTDASLIRRMRFQRATQALNLALAATGKTTTSAMTTIHASSTTTTSSYINKDNRFMNAAAAAAQQQQQQQQQAQIQAAIQASPDWLRPLLHMLPLLSRRTGLTNTSTKPPPHMIEMTLASLRKHQLPAVRPVDTPSSKTTKNNHKTNSLDTPTDMMNNKRKLQDINAMNGGGADLDSSDDEDNAMNAMVAGGYGAQFRSRQRARLMTTAAGVAALGTTMSTTTSNKQSSTTTDNDNGG